MEKKEITKFFEEVYPKVEMGVESEDDLRIYCLMEELKMVTEKYAHKRGVKEQLKNPNSGLMENLMSLAVEGNIDMLDFVERFPDILNNERNKELENVIDKELWYMEALASLKTIISSDARRKDLNKYKDKNVSAKLNYDDNNLSAYERRDRKHSIQAILDGYEIYNTQSHIKNPGIFIFDKYKFYLEDWITGMKIAKYIPIYEEELRKLNGVFTKDNINDKEFQNITKKNGINVPPQSDYVKPIWWKGTERQLGYLMDKLRTNGLIDGEHINKIIEQHFVNKDKERIKNAKSNRSGAINQTKNGKPRGSEIIDTIVSETKNTLPENKK
ncbi:MAG: hypothetical protein DI598_14735 [Pseudopedobacter saltans]|uniref:Uncharacterized protein n=1 Tax=Pseudopedobacter saltans TaxID=151895 RepID=A0A2W5GF15_9SPHI|nr:MAG: hypothetical protein DI598_14735 [Pseudopedobacter saltans]